MTSYLVLYRSSVTARDQMANASPEQAQAGMDAWTSWAGKAGSAITDMGSPVSLAGTVGAARQGDDSIGGYSVMDADSFEALRALLDGHPQLVMDGATIEVHEILHLPAT